MATFKIPVTYEVYGHIEIEANTLEEAFDKAHKDIDNLPLVDDPQYVDDSYEIGDIDMARYLNGER